jgi:nitroreductase
MQTSPQPSDWEAFNRVSQGRRAIRDFDGRPLDPETMRDVLSAALLAPSSANIQPYQLHVVESAELRAEVAEACNQQRAAKTASALVVVVSSLSIARTTLLWQMAKVSEAGLSERAQAYHRGVHKKLRGLLKFAPLPVWDALRGISALLFPTSTLMPIGSSGVRQWAARNSMFAAQNLMLAATARGLDSCPMEGFSALKLSRLLRLPRGSVNPVVVALGYRRDDAQIEPQMRRDLRDVVVSH